MDRVLILVFALVTWRKTGSGLILDLRVRVGDFEMHKMLVYS